MVQNVRAYSIPYAITIKCINCMQEKIDFSCKADLNQNFSSLLGYKGKATKNINNELQENFQGWQKVGIPGGHLPPHATPCQLRTCHCIRVAGALAEISHAIDSSRV